MQYSALVILTALLKTVASSTFTNPLKPKDGADPFMMYVEGGNGAEGYYYLLNTATARYIESIRATTLEGLKNGTMKTVWSDPTPSRCCSLWAPELHELNDT